MKKAVSILLAVFCVSLGLAGCSAAPAAEEAAAPCLPGLAWGMTKEEACEALGWKLVEAVSSPVEGESNAGSTVYTFSDKTAWGSPVEEVRLVFEESTAPLDRGLYNITIVAMQEEYDRLAESMEKQYAARFTEGVLKGAKSGEVFTEDEWSRLREKLVSVREQFGPLPEDATSGRTDVEVWDNVMKTEEQTPLVKITALPSEEDGTVIFYIDGMQAAMLNQIRAGR